MTRDIKCSSEAREKCPFPRTCERDEDAYFEEGSPCHAFNLKIMRPPPKTNADHIRSMADKELAVLLSKPWCENHRLKEECLRFDTDCEACVMDWLKQPYKEDNE